LEGLVVKSQAFRVGDLCAQYEIVSLLAVGGSGEVYRAVQRSMGRTVALKCLQLRHVARSDLKARMEMESRALGRINHPNVVTVYDAGCTDDGVVWIAMELLVGHTMREVLQERWRLPLAEAVSCAIDVAEGVGAAHEQQIIHRDIKPENVFLTERGVTKVLDLGTAKIHGWGKLKTTDRGRVIGTPAYMAPEHIRCVGVDARTDVYAVGLLLYEMLAGHPFAHMADLDDYQEIARLQLYGTPRPLTQVVRSVPEGVSRVVLRALSKDVARRQQSMPEFLAELRDAAGMPAPVRHVTPSVPPVREVVSPATRGPVAEKAGSLGPHGTLRLPNPGGQGEAPPIALQNPPPRVLGPTPDASWSIRKGIDIEAPPRDVGRGSRRPAWLGSALLVGVALGIAGGGTVIWLASGRQPEPPMEAAVTRTRADVAASSSANAPVAPLPAAPAEDDPPGDPEDDPAPEAVTVATPPRATFAPAASSPAQDWNEPAPDNGRLHPDPVLSILPPPTRTAAPASEPPRKMPPSGL
jgi:serine/threonine protein kinase